MITARYVKTSSQTVQTTCETRGSFHELSKVILNMETALLVHVFRILVILRSQLKEINGKDGP